MSKTYQPIVIERTNDIIRLLEESKFFEDYRLYSTDFARGYLLDRLTEKFIEGTIESTIPEIFTEDEFDVCIKQIIAGTVCHQLMDKGLLNSYQDDNTEEVFFLTEDGKKYIEEMRKFL